MTFITIRSLASFIPFLVLLLVAYEIVARNFGNRQHRLTGALAFAIGLTYLGDFLLQIVDMRPYLQTLVRAKYATVFIVMSLAIYFFYMIGRPGPMAKRWHAVALLPLSGALCLLAFPRTFYVRPHVFQADGAEHYSAGMIVLIAAFSIFRFFGFSTACPGPANGR